MDGEKLLDVAEETATRLHAASWEHPFGPDWEVFKVGGKVFLLTTQVPGRGVITVKCEPDAAAELVQRQISISPGYHMNKRHWVSAWPGDDVDEVLVRDLIENSHRLVAGSLPRARQTAAGLAWPPDGHPGHGERAVAELGMAGRMPRGHATRSREV